MIFSAPRLFLAFLPLLCGYSCAVSAEQGLFLSQSAGFSVNPLGVLIETGAFYRIPLSKSQDILWKNTRIDIGILNGWAPADDVFGLRVAYEPIGIFDITLKAGYYGMFDAFGYGYYDMPSPSSPYDGNVRKNLDPMSVNGWWLSAAPRLKVKIGRVLAIDCVTANYFLMQKPGYFLEVQSYTIHQTKDIDIQNDLYALFEFSGSVLAGANYHTITVRNSGVFSDRLSAIAIITPVLKQCESPFIAALAGIYFRDPLFRMHGYVGMQAGFELKMRNHEKKRGIS
jgi:hypothetical protein